MRLQKAQKNKQNKRALMRSDINRLFETTKNLRLVVLSTLLLSNRLLNKNTKPDVISGTLINARIKVTVINNIPAPIAA
jgi:hypothetical protein